MPGHAWGMRFSEHELTAALHGVAKSVLAAQRRGVPKGSSIEEVWEAMDRLERFTLLDGLGSQVLPVLVALPDVVVEPGSRPTYDDAVVTQVVLDLLGEGGGLGRVKRGLVVKGRTALVQVALAAVPLRRDPDALLPADDTDPADWPQVPDDLRDL